MERFYFCAQEGGKEAGELMREGTGHGSWSCNILLRTHNAECCLFGQARFQGSLAPVTGTGAGGCYFFFAAALAGAGAAALAGVFAATLGAVFALGATGAAAGAATGAGAALSAAR